jgi:4-hydroxy-2-oxoheptanedioate aldolase
MVQIESGQGLENIEEIAKVDGVDVLFVGPADLHASLGHLGETSNTEVVASIDDAIERIVAAGKVAGVFAPVERLALRWIERGALLVAVGSDVGVLARGSERLLDGFRELTG